MALKSLGEYEAQRRMENARRNATGIACPDCGGELMYTGGVMLTYPPKRRVYCEDCDFTTMVLA